MFVRYIIPVIRCVSVKASSATNSSAPTQTFNVCSRGCAALGRAGMAGEAGNAEAEAADPPFSGAFEHPKMPPQHNQAAANTQIRIPKHWAKAAGFSTLEIPDPGGKRD